MFLLDDFFTRINFTFKFQKTIMSKDKGGKNDKKAKSTESSKTKSDYQSGKGKSSSETVNPFAKKK
jgi:hypothetical protein